LCGGGTVFKPGEISLAHNGVLFLDELPEFNRTVLETLRQPLEDRCITISRAKYNLQLPCSIMLVAAMNPCPCGYYNDPSHHCDCSPAQIKRYMNRISGPFLDRIDLQIEVTPVPFEDLAKAPQGESSAAIRARIIKARDIQRRRFAEHSGIYCNAQMTSKLLQKYIHLNEESEARLNAAMKHFDLSARAYERILKVARTIADLAGSETIESLHIAEAIGYRNLDRGDWAERGR
jgi:magnesium chelatase family protein